VRVLLTLIILAVTRVAAADAVDEGMAFASQHRFTEAIAKFKQARTEAPSRGETDCLIALAYRRLERWGQAKLFLSRCQTVAREIDWLPQLVADIDAGIAHAQLVAVSLSTEPRDVTIGVGSFAPDETFAPQTIYLAPGTDVVTIAAAGYKTERIPIELVPPSQHVDVKLSRLEPPTPTARSVPLSIAVAPEQAPRRHPEIYFFSGAAAAVAVGVTAHILAAGTANDASRSVTTWQNDRGRFDVERDIAYASYGVAAVSAAVAVWLSARGRDQWIAPTGTSVAWGMTW